MQHLQEPVAALKGLLTTFTGATVLALCLGLNAALKEPLLACYRCLSGYFKTITLPFRRAPTATLSTSGLLRLKVPSFSFTMATLGWVVVNAS